ncbi:hypothetical protein BJY04DRAFT_195021 [Aspergillus karnatakaensis]|uniref:uncharacterized protein n=1 Tax=Aspergillus karnatakaensis TaxID=1810916 RepID=UPI003CCD2727
MEKVEHHVIIESALKKVLVDPVCQAAFMLTRIVNLANSAIMGTMGGGLTRDRFYRVRSHRLAAMRWR